MTVIAEILKINISPTAGAPMVQVDEAMVSLGGVEDDRYSIDPVSGVADGTHSGTRLPDTARQVSIYSEPEFAESMEMFSYLLSEDGVAVPRFMPEHMRRNLYVSANIGALNMLVEGLETFCVGPELVLQATDLCTPCKLPVEYLQNPDKLFQRGMSEYDVLALQIKAFIKSFKYTGGIRATVVRPGPIYARQTGRPGSMITINSR